MEILNLGGTGGAVEGAVTADNTLTENEVLLGDGDETAKTLPGSDWDTNRLLIPGRAHAGGFYDTNTPYSIAHGASASILTTGSFLKLDYTGASGTNPEITLTDVADGSAFMIYFTSTEADEGIVNVTGAGSINLPVGSLCEIIRVGSDLLARRYAQQNELLDVGYDETNQIREFAGAIDATNYQWDDTNGEADVSGAIKATSIVFSESVNVTTQNATIDLRDNNFVYYDYASSDGELTLENANNRPLLLVVPTGTVDLVLSESAGVNYTDADTGIYIFAHNNASAITKLA